LAKTKKSNKVAPIQPKLKEKQKKLHNIKAFFRIINLILLSIFLYGYYLVWDLPFWKVQVVELVGLTKIGNKYIQTFNPEKSYKGHNILKLDSSKISKKFGNFRVFENVNSYRSLFPAKLIINFKERVPYINIYDSTSEKDLTIDEDGIVLTYLKKSEFGKSIYTVKKVKDFKITPEQMNVVRVIENLIKNKEIVNIGYFDITNNNNIILTTLENKVLLGNLDDLIMKIKSLPALENLSKTNKNELEYIDVRYWRNPVLKLKKGSD